MATRPLVIAFDVIETLFPLKPLRQRLVAAGQPGHVLELWFSTLLRDAFALVASGGYRPFGDIAANALRSTADSPITDQQVHDVLAGFAELDPHPDVEPAMRTARDAGVRVITLTNGSVSTTAGLLRRAGLDRYIEASLSVDDIRRWKPAPEIYLHAANTCRVPPGRVALVAAHAWDTTAHGRRACSRAGSPGRPTRTRASSPRRTSPAPHWLKLSTGCWRCRRPPPTTSEAHGHG